MDKSFVVISGSSNKTDILIDCINSGIIETKNN